MEVRVSDLHTGRALLPRDINFLVLVLISLRRRAKSLMPSWSKLKKKMHSPHRISNPRPSGLYHNALPTMLQRAPCSSMYDKEFTGYCMPFYWNAFGHSHNKVYYPVTVSCLLSKDWLPRDTVCHSLPPIITLNWKQMWFCPTIVFLA
jgi:hypothetical protein